MHLDVIGVPVAAMIVVDRENVGEFLVEDLRQALRRLVGVGGPEGTVGVVLGCPHHSRVEVIEELDARHAEDLGGPLRLLHPPLGHQLAGLEHVVTEAGVLTPGRHDEDHPVPFRRCLRHHPGGGDGLVIGMGVEGHERVRHGGILAHARPCQDSRWSPA